MHVGSAVKWCCIADRAKWLRFRAQNGVNAPPAHEVSIFARLGRHPNLAQLLATTRKPTGEYAMVMEFARHGSLSDFLVAQVVS